MSTTKQMWLWVVLLPVFTILGLTMSVWSSPRFLGLAGLLLLSFAEFTCFFVLAAIPASIYFAATALIHRKKNGEFVQRSLKSLAALCFSGLTILALGSALSIRHQAFVRASHSGDRIAQALAHYRNDKGEYPESLDQLLPRHLEQIPYSGLIAYPEFSYRKDYHDIRAAPGEYELRINCTTGALNFDRFIYWPSENYPDRIQGNRVERIRGWAYVHE